MDPIVVEHLTKQYRAVRAVDDLSFSVGSGRVTGFLGPNGAGKTTTLRALLGLVRPTSGGATFAGTPYPGLAHPMRHVGAVLEVASSFHPARRARTHLAILATAGSIPRTRVAEVLDLVGLTEAGNRRVGGFSLGMRQRLGLAGALLGDPEILVLDEPTNGLDPAGVRWLRDLLRRFAADGRTVLVSSHLLSEVAQTVDDVVVIASGRLVTQAPLSELEALVPASHGVRIRTPDAAALRDAVHAAGMTAADGEDGTVVITGATTAEIGRVIANAGLVVYEMQPLDHLLEDVFLQLVQDEGSAK